MPYQFISPFSLEEMRENFEQLCTKRETFLMIGDFDFSEDDDSLDRFMQESNLENFVKVPTCFNPINTGLFGPL